MEEVLTVGVVRRVSHFTDSMWLRLSILSFKLRRSFIKHSRRVVSIGKSAFVADLNRLYIGG